MVEEIEELGAELDVSPFSKNELLRHNQVLLEESRTVQKIALEVTERTRLRNRKGRRIEDHAILVEEGIDTRDHVGAANGSRGTAARFSDYRCAIRPRRGEVAARGRLQVEKIRARDLHWNRQATTHIHNRAQLPTAEQCLADAGATLTKRQRVYSAQVESLAHVEVVIAVVIVEVRNSASVVARRYGFVRASTVAAAGRVGVLRIERHAGVEASPQRSLEGVVAVVPAGGFVIDFGERILNQRIQAWPGRDDGEFANDNRGAARSDAGKYLPNLVSHAAQEKIAPLAAYISKCQRHFGWQFLLDRNRVGVNALRHFIIVAVISAWLKRTSVWICVEAVDNILGIGRERVGLAGQRRTDAVGFDRLNLVFELPRSVVDAETGADHRFAAADEACAALIWRPCY